MPLAQQAQQARQAQQSQQAPPLFSASPDVVVAGPAELARNPRARSAKLRVLTRLAEPPASEQALALARESAAARRGGRS